MYATLALLRRPSSGLYDTEKKPTEGFRAPFVLISWLKSWITGMSMAVEHESIQSRHS
jgi:hypothetical protein